MFPLTHGLSPKNARIIVGAIGGLRSAAAPARSVFSAANVRTQLAYNETQAPLTVVVHQVLPTTSAFGPLRDSFAGVNSIIRPITPNVGAASTTFVLRPYEELWVTSIGANGTYRVSEIRV